MSRFSMVKIKFYGICFMKQIPFKKRGQWMISNEYFIEAIYYCIPGRMCPMTTVGPWNDESSQC